MDFRPLYITPYPSITEYGLVGDGHSAALVSCDGGIDWWCPGRFDYPSVFARLLDWHKGGHFIISVPVIHKRLFSYVEDTNVLETRFVTSDVVVTLTTFMPYDGDTRRIIRLLQAEGKEVDVSLEFQPAFDYARKGHSLSSVEGGIIAETNDERLVLSSTAALPVQGNKVAATFRLKPGDQHAFILDYGRENAVVMDPLAVARESLEKEKSFWRRWASKCSYEGEYRGDVLRSLLALKLLQYAPNGAIVAAPTTSLPETVGQARNWDYRYVWPRDGSFIVMAMESAGYKEESDRFKEWLAAVLRRDAPEKIRNLYCVDGFEPQEEKILDHLEGYRGSRPVRIGNEAAWQYQLDTFGEITMCFHRSPETFSGENRTSNWNAIRSMVERVCERWREPDSGIWEIRGGKRQYVFSKSMAWIVVQHGIEIVKNFGLDGPVERWRDIHARIHEFLLAEGYNEEFGSFVQTTERPDADASNLMLPIFGVVPYSDYRMKSTVERAVKDLGSHGLLHRYTVDDNLQGSEGAFIVASFWLCQIYANLHEFEKARAAFERAMHTSGALRLLAEQGNGITGEALGNYPQGFSHLGLITAAVDLDLNLREASSGAAGP
ncbi:MAG: glycoside hydrolase family 15 protein [Dehalococcoidia bacterium]|nr:glycoside hydrolase family 15 protein [Dehalococcoidia bacterium]